MSAILIGLLAAYYFGLRVGYWAAGATFAVCLAALIVPRLAMPLYLVLAGGAIALWQVGSRRPRPRDAVLMGRMARRAAGRAWQKLFGGRDDR